MRLSHFFIDRPIFASVISIGFVILGGGFLFTQLSSELTPPEDRGVLNLNVQAPEGAGFDYTRRVVAQVEEVMHSYVEAGEADLGDDLAQLVDEHDAVEAAAQDR